MHKKTVVFARDGLSLADQVSRAVSGLDAELVTCSVRDLSSAAAGADLVVTYADAAHAGNFSEIGSVLSSAGCKALLLIVEQDALRHLRMPTHLACDFVMSQSSEDEYAVRIRCLLWPGEETSASDFITVDSMSINLSTYQVQVDGEPVDFTYLEYALLAFLVTHPGHAYSRDTLLRRVWGFEYYGGSRTVDVHVRRVRAKLGNELAARLETVRGVGYMWSM